MVSKSQTNNTKQDQKQKELRREVYRAIYRKSFWEFFQHAVKDLEPQTSWCFGWYMQYICNTLEQEVFRMVRGEKKDRDIILNVPPRFSKSNIISIVFPVWIWIVFPECRILSISNSDLLSIDHSSSSLRLLQSTWFTYHFPEVQISKDQSSKSYYGNTKGGKRLASSIGANIIGHSCNVLILDDPNKDSSTVGLENVVKVYKETIYSRLNNPNVDIRILLQQRLGDGDLTAWCLKSNPEAYKHICLPATDELGNVEPAELQANYKNGLLFPERFDLTTLQNERINKGSWGYSSQFLLSPTSIEGDIIKKEWFEIVDIVPNIDFHFFVDTAFTKNSKNDPSAILIAGFNQDDKCIYIRDCIEVWYEFPQLIAKIKELGSRYPASTKIYIEPKANGLSIIQSLKSSTMLNVISLPSPTQDKITRLNSVVPKIEARRIKLISGVWNTNFLNTVCSFPKGKDDITDCLYYAIQKLLVQRGSVNLRSV